MMRSQAPFILLVLVSLGLAVGLNLPRTVGQAAAPSPTPLPTMQAEFTPVPLGVPVVINGETLFYVKEKVGAFSPQERAQATTRKINGLIIDPFQPAPDIYVAESQVASDVYAGSELILISISDQDAAGSGYTRQEAAQLVAEKIARIVAQGRQAYSLQAAAIGLLKALLAVTIFVALAWLVDRLYGRLVSSLEARFDRASQGDLGGVFRSPHVRRYPKMILNLVRWGLILLLLAIFVPLTFSLIPWTRSLAADLAALVKAPLSLFWNALVNNLPSLVTLLVIGVGAWLVNQAFIFVLNEIEAGTIRLRGFDPEWAPFTRRIISFMIVIAAVIIGFPYVPGSDSLAFQGVIVFLGFLLTISDSTAVANVIAGVVETYTGAFRLNDVVKIGDTVGIVVEKGLLVTKLRTFKNEDVSVPNSLAVSQVVVNYSAEARQSGLILHTAVTIGYSAPWQQVCDLLISAALQCPAVLKDPPPFVLQPSLNDWHITYELNAYTDQPQVMPLTLTELHQRILDVFNEAGVEIMSPTYYALRDGNEITIPSSYWPPDYRSPAFRLSRQPGEGPPAPAAEGGETPPA